MTKSVEIRHDDPWYDEERGVLVVPVLRSIRGPRDLTVQGTGSLGGSSRQFSHPRADWDALESYERREILSPRRGWNR